MAEYDLELLLSVCSGLGRSEWVGPEGAYRKVYQKQEDCLACLKDLQRFLRRDDPDMRDAFFKVGELGVAQAHLVPLLVTYPHEAELAYNTLKVLTLLTMPVDAYSDKPSLQIQLLQDIKAACLNQDALAAVVALCAGPLSRHPRMQDADHAALQLVLTFIRNLLVIPDASAAAAGGGARSRMREDLLKALLDEDALEVLLLVAGHASQRTFRSDAPLLLDILSEVFSGLDPATLLDAKEQADKDAVAAAATAAAAAAAAGPSGRGGQQRPANGGAMGGEGDIIKRAARPPQPVTGAAAALAKDRRHSRFRSTLVRKHVDSDRLSFLSMGQQQQQQGLKELQPVLQTKAPDPPKRSASSALLARLASYAESLLAGPYNVLMAHLRHEMAPGLGISRLEAPDFTKFLVLAGFFTGYVRHKQERAQAASGGSKRRGAAEPSPFGAISATMGWETFHMVQTLWLGQVDIPAKSDSKDWPLLHAATALFKDMLYVLDLADRTGNDADRQAADRLERRLLHDDVKDSGLLPILGRMMKTFSAKYQPRSHACDLVETVHVVLRMYDRLTAREGGAFLVKAKKRGGAGRRRKEKKDDQQSGDERDGDRARDQGEGGNNAAAAPGAAGAAGQGQKRQQGEEQQTDQQEDTRASPRDRGTSAEPEAAVAGAAAEAAAAAAAADGAPRDAAAGADGGGGTTAAAAPPAAGDAGTAAHRLAQPATEPVDEGEGETSPRAGRPPAIAATATVRPAAAGGNGDGDTSRGASPAPVAALGPDEGRERAPMEELELGLEDEDEEDDEPRTHEVVLDLKRRLRQELAMPAVLHFYAWLLGGYGSVNSRTLNHALCSFLWRVVLPEHLDLEPMLYQLSMLRLFHKVLSDGAIRGKEPFKELLLLATKIVRGLFARLIPQQGQQQGQQEQAGQQQGKQANKQQGSEDSSGAAAGSDQDEDNGGHGQGKGVEDSADRRAKVQDATSSMLFVDLLFWKSAATADEIRQGYFLGPEARHRQMGGGGRAGGKPSRAQAAAAAALGEYARGAAGADAWDEDEQDIDGPAPAPRPAGEAAPPPPRRNTGAAAAPLLNAAGVAKLKKLFEPLCAERSNLEELTRKLGGADLSPKLVTRELRRLGLKFGALPDWMVPVLQELHSRHAGAAEAYDKIARELPGGWSAKQVRKLLSDHGMEGNKRRRRLAGGAGSDADDEGPVLMEVAVEQLEEMYSRLVADDDYLEKMAEELSEHDATPAAVLATLRQHGIVQRPAPRARAPAGGGRRKGLSRADALLLEDLWEEHGEEEDALNLVAMQMPGGYSVQEVRKLLAKQGLLGPRAHASQEDQEDGASGAHGRPPLPKEELQALYQQHKGKEGWLEAMGEALPVPTPDQVLLKWLEKLGIVEKQRRRPRGEGGDGGKEGGGVGVGGGGRRAGSGAAGGGGGNGLLLGAVPEPQPTRLLAYMAAMQRAHEGNDRWLSAQAAADWIAHKLSAAEDAWALTGPNPCRDYALVPNGDTDLDFFCTDFSTELLEAAGIRNDEGDYFKVPGNGGSAWRGRVRAALSGAVGKLGSSEAEAALEALGAEALPPLPASRATPAAPEAAPSGGAGDDDGDGGGAGVQRAGKGGKRSAAKVAEAAGKSVKKGKGHAARPVSGQRRGRIAAMQPAAEHSDDNSGSSSGSESGADSDGSRDSGGSSARGMPHVSSSESEGDDDAEDVAPQPAKRQKQKPQQEGEEKGQQLKRGSQQKQPVKRQAPKATQPAAAPSKPAQQSQRGRAKAAAAGSDSDGSTGPSARSADTANTADTADSNSPSDSGADRDSSGKGGSAGKRGAAEQLQGPAKKRQKSPEEPKAAAAMPRASLLKQHKGAAAAATAAKEKGPSLAPSGTGRAGKTADENAQPAKAKKGKGAKDDHQAQTAGGAITSGARSALEEIRRQRQVALSGLAANEPAATDTKQSRGQPALAQDADDSSSDDDEPLGQVAARMAAAAAAGNGSRRSEDGSGSPPVGAAKRRRLLKPAGGAPATVAVEDLNDEMADF